MVKKNEENEIQETKIEEHFIVGIWKSDGNIILKIVATFILMCFSIPIFLLILIVLTIVISLFKEIYNKILSKIKK